MRLKVDRSCRDLHANPQILFAAATDTMLLFAPCILYRSCLLIAKIYRSVLGGYWLK